jgi:anti-sigma factor RsiW
MDLHNLTCRELVELVTDYFEGALTPQERARFEQHASGCSYCQAYLEQMRQTIRLTGKLTEDQIAPQARDELLRAFRKWKLSE